MKKKRTGDALINHLCSAATELKCNHIFHQSKRRYLHKPRLYGTICSEENSATNGYIDDMNQRNYNHQRREQDSVNHLFGEQK